jgi:hypothetical protein
MAYMAPQSVLNYYKDYGPFSGKDPSFTDENGFMWLPQYEDVASDGNMRLVGYRTGTAPGVRPGVTEDTNIYFDTSGNFTHVNKDDKGWLNPITGILAVASLGLGAGALAAGGEAAGAIGAGEAAAGGSGAFLGEGVASGIGAWDGAMAGATAGGAGAAGAGAGYLGDYTAAGYGGLDAGSTATMGGGYAVDGGAALGGTSAMGAAGGGTPPPANPYATGGTPPPSNPYATPGSGMDWSSMLSNPNYAQLLTTALGAVGGAQGVQNEATSTRAMDPRMDSLFYGNLAPQTQGLLGAQMPAAYQAGGQMISKGSGLLGQTAPDTATNPYATGILSDMQRRYGDLIGQQLNNVKGNSVAVGGLGGSRQGVAEAQAITQGADNFAGQGFNFMGGLYNQDQNRLRQDWTLGAGLMGQGLDTQFRPLQNAANIYAPFNGFGSTTNSTQQGGGWQGALGGALGAAQFGQNMGWWG